MEDEKNVDKMTIKQKVGVGLCSVFLVLFFGCAAVQDIATPVFVDEKAAEHAGVPARLLPFPPWTNLADARRIDRALDLDYAVKTIHHGYYKGEMAVAITAGESLRDTLFSPTGPVALLATLLPGGAIASQLIPRTKDTKKIKALEAKLNGKVEV